MAMEQAPSERYIVTSYPDKPFRAEVKIGNSGIATFAYDPKTKELIRTGLFVHSAIDIPGEDFIGRGPLKNAAERARKHFEALQAQEKLETSTKPQYELDLGDQTLH